MIEACLLAFQFLTRIPIRREIDFKGENLARSIFYYPLVGLFIGGLSLIGFQILAQLSSRLGAFAALVGPIVLTGGLHIDGLADSFDGFYSSRKREEVLEIMQDSRIGSFGALAIFLNLLLKYLILLDLGTRLFPALPLSLANSRLVVGYAMSYQALAKEEGLGHMFGRARPARYFILSFLAYSIFLILINPAYLLPLALNFIYSFLLSKKAYSQIGGYTGDVYGMLIERGETISMLGFMGVFKWIL